MKFFAGEAYKSLKRSASAPLSKVVPAIKKEFQHNSTQPVEFLDMALAHLDQGIITETYLKNMKHNTVKAFQYASNKGSSSDILRCKDLPKQLKIWNKFEHTHRR